MIVEWTSANRALLARATAVLAINRIVGFPEPDAQTMTVVCLAEGNGYLDIVGPIRKDPATGALMVGNDNGTVDVSTWQINGAEPGLSPLEYARRACDLWGHRGFAPWYAWKGRAKNVAWPLFEAIVTEAVKASALPPKYAEAKKHRKGHP